MILMIASFVMMAGFMYWLSVTAEPTKVAVREGDGSEEDLLIPSIQLRQFTINPQSFIGRTIRLRNVPVSSPLGTHAFWTQLTNGTPYLVRMDSLTVASGTSVQSLDLTTVVGRVWAMSDSILDSWMALGVLADDLERVEAEFATSFVEAESVDVVPGGAATPGG
jgi:hypothetical protein